MKAALVGILCAFVMGSLSAHAVNEPQTLDPKLDQILINRLGLWQPGQPVPDIFNILIIGQDDGTRNPRGNLSSRSDIIMLLSLNRLTKSHTILSIYRDHPPSAGCEARIGNAPDGKINGVYSLRGRQGFIPCIEGMFEEFVKHLPPDIQSNVVMRGGRIRVHALIEGTRSQTVKPLGRDIVSVVNNNKAMFLGTFGVMKTAAALTVLGLSTATGQGPSYLLGSDLTEEQARKMVNDRYLTVELKERKIYPAGGYQRAFNLATVMANVLGWSGYGIVANKNNNFEFLGKYFGDAVNKNMGRSVDVKVLETEVLNRDGEHLFAQLCYKNGASPLTVVQWGESANIYTIYAKGRISKPTAPSLLKQLKYVDILPSPSDCN